MNSSINNKKQKIELDIYERHYITINGLEFITYSEDYLKGYTGSLPRNINAGETYSPVFGYISYIMPPLSYKDRCIDYIKRLTILFDRIKGITKLLTPVKFDKTDLVKFYWKMLNDCTLLHTFLITKPVITKVLKKKVDEFKNESENLLEKSCISPININCLISRTNNICSK